MAIDWKKLARRMEELIRSGKSALVVEEFERLRKERVPREHAVQMANIAFRVDANYFGLRALSPIVRSEKKKIGVATDPEKAEYAYGLVRIGAPEEALEILGSINSEKYPRTKYYQACAHINRWEYRESIPLLESYISEIEPTSYPRIVAETNLSASYLYEKEVGKAEVLLASLLEKARTQKLTLVQGKVLQFMGELFLQKKQWTDFDETLSEAKKLFRLTAGKESFLLKKLMFQKDLELNPEEMKAKFPEMRAEAVASTHYESVRDCDRLFAIYFKDLQIFYRVYFGSPQKDYRKKLVEDFNQKVDIPDHWEWKLSESAKREHVDLERSNFGKGKQNFDLGSLPHRLLVGLCKDFYRPIRIATLHHVLYPGEYFNPVSSPLKVHRILQRLRECLEAENSSLQIEETKEFYSISEKRPTTIRVQNPDQEIGPVTDGIFRLMKLFPNTPFSISQASKAVGIPERTLSRQLKKCLEEGKAVHSGKGSAARYLFQVQTKKAA